MEENELFQSQIAAMMNCKAGKFPITYLGIPLRPHKLLLSDWQPLLEKVDRRLFGWTSSCLPRGGRLILVNSVLKALPMYLMSFFLLPKWVIVRIDKVRIFLFFFGKKRMR